MHFLSGAMGPVGALLGGFLEVAHRTKLPLRILEVGASAGLNLNWDRYRYESTDGAWGDHRRRGADGGATAQRRRCDDLHHQRDQPKTIDSAMPPDVYACGRQTSRMLLRDHV